MVFHSSWGVFLKITRFPSKPGTFVLQLFGTVYLSVCAASQASVIICIWGWRHWASVTYPEHTAAGPQPGSQDQTRIYCSPTQTSIRINNQWFMGKHIWARLSNLLALWPFSTWLHLLDTWFHCLWNRVDGNKIINLLQSMWICSKPLVLTSAHVTLIMHGQHSSKGSTFNPSALDWWERYALLTADPWMSMDTPNIQCKFWLWDHCSDALRVSCLLTSSLLEK